MNIEFLFQSVIIGMLGGIWIASGFIYAKLDELVRELRGRDDHPQD